MVVDEKTEKVLKNRFATILEEFKIKLEINGV
jgi:hypothetical protein